MLAFDLTAEAAKEGDLTVIRACHRDIIDPAAPGQGGLRGRGGQMLARLGGGEIGDLIVLRNDKAVIAVAGKGKGAVGQRKDDPAMADAVPVQMIGAHGQRQHGLTRRNRVDLHAKRL